MGDFIVFVACLLFWIVLAWIASLVSQLLFACVLGCIAGIVCPRLEEEAKAWLRTAVRDVEDSDE